MRNIVSTPIAAAKDLRPPKISFPNIGLLIDLQPRSQVFVSYFARSTRPPIVSYIIRNKVDNGLELPTFLL